MCPSHASSSDGLRCDAARPGPGHVVPCVRPKKKTSGAEALRGNPREETKPEEERWLYNRPPRAATGTNAAALWTPAGPVALKEASLFSQARGWTAASGQLGPRSSATASSAPVSQLDLPCFQSRPPTSWQVAHQLESRQRLAIASGTFNGVRSCMCVLCITALRLRGLANKQRYKSSNTTTLPHKPFLRRGVRTVRVTSPFLRQGASTAQRTWQSEQPAAKSHVAWCGKGSERHAAKKTQEEGKGCLGHKVRDKHVASD